VEDATEDRHAARHEPLLTRCTEAKKHARAMVERARQARARAWQVVTGSVRARRQAGIAAPRS
jgi:hypothetical protein